MTPTHIHGRTIDFAETDMAGLVHFSNFFRFMESAEAAFLRSIGLSLHTAHSDHAWPRVRTDCHYQKPVHFGDLLETQLHIRRLGQSSIDYGFVFHVGRVQVAHGGYTVVHVKLGPERGQRMATRLPEALRAKLEPLVEPTGTLACGIAKAVRP